MLPNVTFGNSNTIPIDFEQPQERDMYPDEDPDEDDVPPQPKRKEPAPRQKRDAGMVYQPAKAKLGIDPINNDMNQAILLHQIALDALAQKAKQEPLPDIFV